jgi:hypothetical protein
LKAVLRLFGVPVRPGDARALVATLVSDDSPHSLKAARTLGLALEAEAALAALTPDERDAILAALEHPRPGLAELRDVLLLDRERRADG